MDLHRRVETGDRDGRLLVLGAVRRASLAIWGKVKTVVCVLSPPGGQLGTELSRESFV